MVSTRRLCIYAQASIYVHAYHEIVRISFPRDLLGDPSLCLLLAQDGKATSESCSPIRNVDAEVDSIQMIIVIRHAQSEGNKNRDIHQMIPDHRVKLTEEGWKQVCLRRPAHDIQAYITRQKKQAAVYETC